MREKLKALGKFTVKIGGVAFTLRRRSTQVLLEAGDSSGVFGLISGANKTRGKELSDLPDLGNAYTDMVRGVLKAAIVEVDGEPFEWDWELVAPVSDALFRHFMLSGLDVDPSPDSSTGPVES